MKLTHLRGNSDIRQLPNHRERIAGQVPFATECIPRADDSNLNMFIQRKGDPRTGEEIQNNCSVPTILPHPADSS